MATMKLNAQSKSVAMPAAVPRTLRGQELVDGARARGERHRRHDLTLALDGAEDQVGAAGVESEHDTRVFHIPCWHPPPAPAVIVHGPSLPLSTARLQRSPHTVTAPMGRGRSTAGGDLGRGHLEEPQGLAEWVLRFF